MIGIAIFDMDKDNIHLVTYRNNIDIRKLCNVACIVDIFKDALDSAEKLINEGKVPEIKLPSYPKPEKDGGFYWGLHSKN